MIFYYIQSCVKPYFHYGWALRYMALRGWINRNIIGVPILI